MTRLRATLPLEGLDLQIGPRRLIGVDPGPVTWIAPFPRQCAALDTALRATLGMGFPAPGQALAGGGVRLLWAGRAQALLIGQRPDPRLGALASLTDVTDGWAAMRLTGQGAAAVLARLTPLDLRPRTLPPGATARSLLGQVSAQITPLGGEGFEILVGRSMARTAASAIEAAMRGVAARG